MGGFEDGHALPGPPLDGLRDIHGIGDLPWWPPAPGWWLLLGAALLLGLALRYRRLPARLRPTLPGFLLGSWRRDAAAALRVLRRRARAGEDPKAVLGDLSELLRRIAMARLGRSACAGLAGPDWLAWLAANDPRGFPWEVRGRCLLAGPYAPPGGDAGRELPALIEAARAWVAAPWPGRRPGPRTDARSGTSPAPGDTRGVGRV